MIHADTDLEDMLKDFFSTEVAPVDVQSAETEGTWSTALWDKAQAIELPWIGIGEIAGGVGGTIVDVAALIRHAAYYAAPLPFLQHHVAAHIVEVAGLKPFEGYLALAGLGASDEVRLSGGRFTGRAHGVEYARDAQAVVIVAVDESGADVAAVVDPAFLESEAGVDLAGLPIHLVDFEGVKPSRVAKVQNLGAVRRRAEVLRLAALAGLQHRLFDLTQGYTSQRHQFGKPVGAFQAVQVHIVALAQSATMSLLAVDRAVSAVASGGGEFEVDAASVVVDGAAAHALAASHQAHGAIGMTREYPLQQVTRRVHNIRQVYSPVAKAQERLGEVAHGAPSFAAVVARNPFEEGS